VFCWLLQAIEVIAIAAMLRRIRHCDARDTVFLH
jgi:hypothetical protein